VSIRTTFIILFAFTFCNCSSAQDYLLANEQIICSFNTVDDKRMVLAKDSADKYIVYRFGTADKIEFEFPEKTKESWSKFTYSFYLRGGGKQNETLDLNYVYFVSNKFKYVIYNTYAAEYEKPECGIKVIDLTTNKTSDIKGNSKTVKGNLIDFRDNNLLEVSDESFE
jgi:hypothetical protein